MADPKMVEAKAAAGMGSPTHVPDETAERRAGERSSAGRSVDGSSGTSASAPDPEVPAKATRRAFTAEYKMRILREADACRRPGDIGALIRREGLYSSHLVAWRRQREVGGLKSMHARKRGRVAKPENPLAEENRRLTRENEHLKKRLGQAEQIIAVQKKVSEAIAMLRAEHESEKSE